MPERLEGVLGGGAGLKSSGLREAVYFGGVGQVSFGFGFFMAHGV